jgi:SulP family sulfate permease
LKDLAGLTLSGPDPGPLFPKLATLGQALSTISPSAFAIGAGSAALISCSSGGARHGRRC